MDATPAQPVQVRHFRSIAIWVIALALLLFFLKPVTGLFLGILATGCVASALHPLVRLLPGPRWLRAIIVGLAPIVIAAGVGFAAYKLLAQPIRDQLQDWPQLRESIDGVLARWSEGIHLGEPLTVTSLGRRAADVLTGSSGGELFATAANAVGSLLVALAFVFFGSMYLLAGEASALAEPVRSVLPVARRPQFDAAFRDLVPRLRWWLLGTLLSMTVVGLASGFAYWLVGLRLALPVGLLTGLSEIVPTLGPAATFLIALLFAASQGGGAVMGVVIAYVIVQVLESYLIAPMVMRQTVKMPPIVTLFTVVLWGQVFGPGGLVLAIPINLVIWTFVDHFVIRPRAAGQLRDASGEIVNA